MSESGGEQEEEELKERECCVIAPERAVVVERSPHSVGLVVTQTPGGNRG